MNKILLLILISIALQSEKSNAEDSEAKDDSFQQIVRFLPLNEVIRNIHVPRFDEEGHQVALMTSSAVTRLDEQNFKLRDLVIHLFGNNEDDDKTVIETAAANYNLRQNLISSDVLTTINRDPTLHVQGEGMVFDTKRHIGRLLRNVRCRLILKNQDRP